MSRPIYRKWYELDGYTFHYWKIYQSKNGTITHCLGVSFQTEKVRSIETVKIIFDEIYLRVPKSAKTITKDQFEKKYNLALKKIAYINRQSKF